MSGLKLQVHIFVAIVEHFGCGKKLYLKLRIRLLALVDDPTFTVVAVIGIGMGEYRNVRMAQTYCGCVIVRLSRLAIPRQINSAIRHMSV